LLWVLANIMSLQPTPSWQEAQEKFAAEFSTHDYAFRCRDNLIMLEQGKMTGLNFLRQVEVYADGAKQDLDEPYFLHTLLRRQISRGLYRLLSTNLGLELHELTFAKLKEKVGFLDALDKNTPAAGADKGDKSNKVNQETTVTKCTYCKKSGHTRAECKKLKAKESAAADATSTKPKLTVAQKAEHLKNVQCHKCKAYGHYANKCPQSSASSSSSSESSSRSLNRDNINARVRAIREEAKTSETAGAADEFVFTEDDVAQALYELECKRSSKG
jgi:hypothetical protein